MKGHHHHHHDLFLLLLLFFSFLWISSFASLPPRDSLGIAPQDESYYKGSVIQCKDGSGKFTRDQLNDDFCDCSDGTDEPGTPACPEGKFYCRNLGHVPLSIFSSRVNDGICDCCDRSDEYDGKTTCENTCWEAGKAARQKLKKKIATYQEGVVIRNQEVEKAKKAFAKDKEELSKLQIEEKLLKGLVDKLREQKERIEKAEEEGRLKKEKEEKRLKEEAERQAVKEGGEREASENVDSQAIDEVLPGDGNEDLEDEHQTEAKRGSDHHAETAIPSNQHVDKVLDNQGQYTKSTENDNGLNNIVSSIGVQKQPEVLTQDDSMLKGGNEDDSVVKEGSTTPAKEGLDSVDTEGLSREELGRLVASRWTGGKANEGHEDELEIPEAAEEEHEDELEIPEAAEGNYDGYNSEMEDDRHKFDEDDFEDESDEEYPDDHEEHTESYKTDEDGKSDHSDLTASGRLSWFDKIHETVQSVFQAFNFFNTPVDISEASHVRKEYDDANSKLSKIQSRMTSLTEKLKQDFGEDKEFYSFYDHCFESKQGKYVYKVCPFKKASQSEGHSTTQLGQWDKFEESHRIMLFSNGDRCWNGPDRSIKVRLRCGLKNELADVDEPSRCEYVAVLSTPTLCQEEKLMELQQKLDGISKNEPIGHDEL